MIGEFLRETGALLFVFGLLDPIVRTGVLTPGWAVGIVGMSGFFLMSGIVLELVRKE